ncbi:MAG: hypothetical protein E6184_07955 [Staphylococcus sp.]|jgi:hypothetical protein|uniref:hypothetical protein n=1 Tax=Staphylococcus haemolyticus TaxID=1283 RepID=UPI0028A3DDC1|nr:hypothetical protein [Staphylococcus haemolyticus]MDU5235230.1 hypothetical protein [Staphylococcus sp.]MDU7578625.1 hypothetical protein [Bacillus subtilis]WNM55397.1 hypothetical protein CoNPh29_CDS0002 [Staphylococcus phage S-CoN_Ph29]WNM55531.1 hypothetical protein CoNPh33_CDS0030 [Staphylococcus phage S-CoN_Ph33]MDT4215061.1 hypothetical protein [Staphylococcus haemolyticus]
MANFDGNEMRGMTHANYEDSRLNKSRELNANMSIATSKSEDEYGRQVHSLTKQTYSDDSTQEV